MPQPYQLKNLFDQGQYEQVVSFWTMPDEVEQFSQWDFRDCMNSFYKLKRYQECLDVYRACSKRYPEFRMLDDKMGWSVYHAKVKNFDFQQGDTAALLKQIDYVFEHSADSRYSPRWVLAKFVADAVKNGKFGGERDYALAVHYLDMVNPENLSTEEQTMTDNSGKIRNLASNRESWFSHKTNLLLKLQDYEACMACCDRAFEALRGVRLHSNNDSWFRYRKAKCLQALNRADEAKAYVEQILKGGFSHWCLLQLMFEFEAEAGNDAKALSYAGACSLSDPEHKMRVGFYEELADYLARSGDAELPVLLRKLVLLLRAENEWKEKSYYSEWQFPADVAAMDKQAVLSRLNPIWREWRDKDKVFLTGTIDRLLAEGKSGFIIADNGSSYYFNARDMHGKTREPGVGMKVRFTLVDKLDKSKGVVKPNAVEISLL